MIISTVMVVCLIVLVVLAANALPAPNPWGNAIRALSTIILVILLIELLMPIFGHGHFVTS